jgi:hypothetical protein
MGVVSRAGPEQICKPQGLIGSLFPQDHDGGQIGGQIPAYSSLAWLAEAGVRQRLPSSALALPAKLCQVESESILHVSRLPSETSVQRSARAEAM